MSEPQYDVVSPEGRWAAKPVGAGVGARPAGRTRRVGFVWDHVFRGDDMFRIAEEELQVADSELRFVRHDAFGDIHGRDEARVLGALPERLRAEEVDAVIVGVGA